VAVGDAVADAPRFTIGDAVLVVARSTSGHTRCPRYTRGQVGAVTLTLPPAQLPELRAHSDTGRTEPTYAVRFACTDLWDDSGCGQWVVVELFESYLELDQ
jgi:nitrile hydratase